MVIIRIHRPSTRSWLIALNDCDPPLTCMTARVLPCVGRTAPIASGIQSICAFMIPVIAPWRSGLHHTWPSDHADSSRSSWTFSCVAGASSGRGRPEGSNIPVSAPKACSRSAASIVAKRLNDRSRSEPYSSKMRGRWPALGLCSSAAAGTAKASPATFGSFGKSVGINDLAVFLDEAPDVRIRQNIKNRLRRPAKLDARRRDNDRPVDEDRVREHEIDQFVVRPLCVAQPELGVWRALLPKQIAGLHLHLGDEFDQFRPRRRVLEIFNDFGLGAASADHLQRVARRSAFRIMIDGDAHRTVSGFIWGSSSFPRNSHAMNAIPTNAPQSSATMKPGRSAGRMPEKVFVKERAIATAGLANDVDAVNQ